MNKVQLIEVTDDVIEQRIDNFLISKFSRLPKSLIYRWIRKGELRVNKKRVKQTTRVSAGDIVRVPPFSLEENLEIIKVSKSHLDFLEQRIYTRPMIISLLINHQVWLSMVVPELIQVWWSV